MPGDRTKETAQDTAQEYSKVVLIGCFTGVAVAVRLVAQPVMWRSKADA
jgi:hypothetical protein